MSTGNRARSRTAPLVVVLALAGGVARADDWTGLGLDPPRSRLSAERSGPAFGAGWELALPPKRDPGYLALVASPAVADGYLIYATNTNVVRGVREHDGRLLWEVRARDGIFASPAVWRGWAYLAGLDRQLYAIGIADGAIKWKRDVGGITYASPAVVDGSVFVASGDPTAGVRRLDAETGKLLWEAGAGILEQAAHASIAVAEGHVLVGEVRGRYHSFAASDGALEWTIRTGGIVNMSSALILNGRAYLLPGGDEHRLFAVDLTTGVTVKGWPVELPATPAASGRGTLLSRTQVVSAPAAIAGQIVFDRRVDDRFDQDGDGVSDSVVLEESVVAVDSEDGHVLWSRPNGRLATEEPNRVPMYGLCPTPALYRGASGETLLAVASTLSAKLRVLDLSSGEERWSAELSGPTRGSPVLANGRLVVGTDAGVVHSFLSRSNQPPAAPGPVLAPSGGQEIDAASVTLRWEAAIDPEGESTGHEVRLDDDGEILHDSDLAVVTAAGQRSLDVTAHLAPGRMYTFSVRGRDGKGAYSPWSPAVQFRVALAPAVQVDGTPVSGLAEAQRVARAGSTISLGAGVYHLSDTVRLPAGVSLAGVAPHLTTLVGKGLAVAVQAGAGNQLRQLTVTGAEVGVEVTAGEDARLQNVVLRDNTQAGLKVGAGARAELVSATVARNGSGVRAVGQAGIRNAIITANGVGIEAAEVSLVTSRYNDVFSNRTADYVNVQRAPTDRADPVVFGKGGDDLRLETAQPTTDQGDPADEFANEPEPNGARINLGAFGNTPFAELSVLLPPPAPPGEPAASKQTGGGLCTLGGAEPDGGLVLVLLALLWGRRRRPRT